MEDALIRVHFENCNAIMRVEDMNAALHFYVDLLGFENATWGTEDFTSISRDSASLYLCRGGQGRGGLESKMQRSCMSNSKDLSINVILPPTDYPWALEMQIEDPFGNVLRFGSEPR